MVCSAPYLSSTTHEGIDVFDVVSIDQTKYKMIIDTYFNQIANKEDSLTSNTAFALMGAHQHPKSSS
jgi:Fe-S cluster assembly protein SufD